MTTPQTITIGSNQDSQTLTIPITPLDSNGNPITDETSTILLDLHIQRDNTTGGTSSSGLSESVLESRLSEGTEVTGISLPSGSGFRGWLSYLWNTVNNILNRLPSLTSTGKIPVDITGQSISISNLSSNQTISGTVTANLGTLNGVALDSSVRNLLTEGTDIRFASTQTGSPGSLVFSSATVNWRKARQ